LYSLSLALADMRSLDHYAGWSEATKRACAR